MSLFILTLSCRIFVSSNRCSYTREHAQKATGRLTTTLHELINATKLKATYSGFTFRSNIPYAVQRKRMLCAYIHLYLKTRHKLPVYGIWNIRTEHKSAVASMWHGAELAGVRAHTH